jgi:uncharacterized protein with NAD-binding domain and iron-sulfur cluster
MPDKIKVAILGGGMGSLAAAWRLTESVADRARYEVTVYQRDWLLGGKGASTRSQEATRGSRIEEHGIHLLLGFYNTALHLLRGTYDELQADPKIPVFDDAIEPWDWVWMADQHPAGVWQKPWRAHFPVDAAVVPGVSGQVPTAGALMSKAVERFLKAMNDLTGLVGQPTAAASPLTPLIEEILALVHQLPRPFLEKLSDLAAGLIDGYVRLAWSVAQSLLAIPEIRHSWVAVYLLGTNLSGALRDRVLLDGTEVIDPLDYRAWLQQHQAVAAPAHVSYESPPIMALYDLSFSRKTGLAAGVSLVAIARMVLGYEGHFLYKMKGGMGEVVFAPLYLALRKRGVTFRFGHEVTEAIAGSDGEAVVEKISLRVPIGSETYTDPLYVVSGKDGVPTYAWPSSPPGFMEQPKTTKMLLRGTDFDVAVLGISVGGLTNALVGTLRTASPVFAAMLDGATHVGTQSMQLWMTKTAAELGWTDPQEAMLISYERPFNSWVDMSHLLPRENWPPAVRSIHYLCDELRAGEGTTEADVEANGIAWIQAHSLLLWPQFVWSDLYDPENRSGPARMDFQYFRANDDGSNRYVTVGPDSVKYRRPPGGSGFRNLALAGDWVRTELSAGCLEAATTGGLGAGQAILDGDVTP